MRRTLIFAFLILLIWPALTVKAGVLQALVVEVHDGNTITVENVGRRIKVVLKGANAPVEDQPYSDVARQHLADLILGKQVAIEYTELGKGGYLVGKVFYDKMDVGQQMIRDGVAWYDKTYENDLTEGERSLYAGSEEAARNERRGLWQEPSPTPPWEWKEAQSAKQKAASIAALTARQASADTAEVKEDRKLTSDNLRTSKLSAASLADPSKWQKIAPEGEYFSVTMPNVGFQNAGKFPLPESLPVAGHYHVVRNNNIEYTIVWVTGPSNGRSVDEVLDDAMSGFKYAFQHMAHARGQKATCDLTQIGSAPLNGYAGRQFTVTGCDMTGIFRTYTRVGNDRMRMYILSVANGIEEDPAVDKFLKSFTISKVRNGHN